MNSALSPREIQARLRSGASLAEVAEAAGVDPSTIEGFAGPVLAEREHIASLALSSTIRRRGEGSSHRRLGELVAERLQQRGIDADGIRWDAWRQEDRRWRVVGLLADEAGERRAEFVFDHKARYGVADNADARWMIGEETPGAPVEEENTVDLDDELALLRATSERRTPVTTDAPGDDVPSAEAMHDDFEDTSELDHLYDLMSGISEDSVRIYTGLDLDEDQGEDRSVAEADDLDALAAADDDASVAEGEDHEALAAADDEPVRSLRSDEGASRRAGDPITEPVQDSLVDDVPSEEPTPQPKPKGRRRGRAHVPSWDEIMFGGPTPKG